MISRGLLSVALLALSVHSLAAGAPGHWVGTWACSTQLCEVGNRPPVPTLTDFTIRQVVQVSLGGATVRLRLSNLFGDADLSLASVHLAVSVGSGAVDPATDRALTFSGSGQASIPKGTQLISDPLGFEVKDGTILAITLSLTAAPHELTAHPGSRTTSYLQSGDLAGARELPSPIKVDHWYFIEGLDVKTEDPRAAAVVVLGDSITDGRGSTTNRNDRWPDRLAQRLLADQGNAALAVLNQGIGGNRILHDGLGPSALARFDRDVIAQSGVRCLIVFEGINDLGGGASAREIISAYQQFIIRAHSHQIKILGGTIAPFEGFAMYFRPEREAARQAINQWIRQSGQFDGVIDFDAATRDPQHPSHLSPEADSGDHLHPNPTGYLRMAGAVDLNLLRN